MTSDVDTLHDLLRRVRTRIRRAQLANATTRAAVVFAFILVIGAIGRFLFFTSLSNEFLVSVSFTAAVVTFAALALRRSPNDAAIARSLDRQLNVHELFASALSTGTAADGASVSIRAMARETAARIRAADVNVDSPSPRRALAAALAVCAALVVTALVPSNVGSTSRNAPDVAAASSGSRSAADAARTGDKWKLSSASNAEPMRTRKSDGATSDDRSAIVDAVNARETNQSSLRAGTSDDGVARGATSDKTSASLAFGAAARSTGSGMKNTGAASGRAAAGVEKDGASREEGSSTASVERSPIGTPNSAISDLAVSQTVNNQPISVVPARCRDLVRAYFDADDANGSPHASTPDSK